jgi:Secretion system C-terminal sorting domain
MRFLLLLLLIAPLSISAQCTEKTPVAWQNADGTAWSDNNGLWLGNDSLEIQKPCLPKQLVFYPNPVVDELKCRNTEGVDLEGTWTIVNMQGQTVLHIRHSKSADMSGLAQGVYSVRLDFVVNKKAEWVQKRVTKI